MTKTSTDPHGRLLKVPKMSTTPGVQIAGRILSGPENPLTPPDQPGGVGQIFPNLPAADPPPDAPPAPARAEPPPPAPKVPEKRVYKSHLKSIQTFTPWGERVVFSNGRCITDDPAVIAWLDKEIPKSSEFYIDSAERVYDPDIHDPVFALRKKLREEILEEMKQRQLEVSGNPQRNMGNTPDPKLTPQSTSDIASVTLGGSPVPPVVKVGG